MRSSVAKRALHAVEKPEHAHARSVIPTSQSESVNRFRALVARPLGTKCSGGWGIAKTAVYSIFNLHNQ